MSHPVRHTLGRRPFLKGLGATALGLAGASALGGCAESPSAAGPTDQINIGLILPMTGQAAVYGAAAYNAITLVVDDVNAKGGIRSLGGAKLATVLKDSRLEPQEAANLASELGGSDVLAIIGTAHSDSTAVATPAAERARVPWICGPEGAQAIVDRGFRYVFMPAAYSADSAVSVTRWVAAQPQRPTRVAVLTSDSAVLTEIGVSLEANAKSNGLNFLWRANFPAANPESARSIIQRAKDDAIDMLFVSVNSPTEAITITRLIDEIGFRPLGIAAASGGHGSTQYGENLGALAEGTIDSVYFAPDLGKKVPRTGELNAMYKDRFGLDLDIVSATSMNAAAVLVDALERVQTPTRDALRDAIAATDLQPGQGYWLTPGGCRFDDKNHNSEMQYALIQWQGGTPRVIDPAEYATTTAQWPVAGTTA